MAAHLKTGIEQVLESITRRQPETLRMELQAATELSCWTEDDTPTWYTLYDYVTGKIGLNELEEQLRDHLIQANTTWLGLGKPSCREEWKRAQRSIKHVS